MSDLSKMSVEELDNHFSIGYGGDDGKMMLDAFNACITRLRAANDDAATNPLYELTRLREQLRVAREGLEKVTDYEDIAWPEYYEKGWNDGRSDAADIARDTLTLIDGMEKNDGK